MNVGFAWSTFPPRSAVAGPVRLGVVMLCHDRLEIAARMARLWCDGGAALTIHVDRSADPVEQEALRAALRGSAEVLWAPRRACDWGTFGLVEATQDGARMILDHFPDVTHVMVVSGSCLPLRPIEELKAFLGRDADTDYIESVNALDARWAIGGLNLERFTLRFPFSFRSQRRQFDAYVAFQRKLGIRRRVPDGIVPHLGSQWWCLTRRTLEGILRDPRREEYERYFRRVWIPDESYFQSLCRRHARRVANASLTLARFDSDGRPYMLFDDHAELLRRSGCFVARKVWAHADGLYARFPQEAGDDVTPDPRAFYRVVDEARQRRVGGRPGLYNQGRFPRHDESDKTAAPYCVCFGLTDVFPGFQTWLAARLDADVHGHVWDRDMVEFAGGRRVGPGALSDSPALRDRDPRSFLTSLVRMSERMPVLMTSARDERGMDWFFATDTNMRMAIVLGSWILPMLRSEMPFDDIRRMAARLQRREVEGMNVLDSPWVRARVRIWTLPQVLRYPGEVLSNISAFMGGPAAAGDPPDMRSAEGLAEMLQRLSGAGLYPRRFGDLGRDDELTPTPLIRGPL